MSSIDEKLPRALNRFSWFFTIFLLGYFVHASGAWPHNIISNGVEAFRDLTAHAKSYLGMFPTRQAAFRPGADAGVTVNKPDKVEPGVTFLAGIEGERNIMKLVDGEGNELHRWMVPFYKAIPNLDHIMPAHLRPMNESMTHIHGAHVYPDGSIVFNFDYHGLVSIDACSNIQWTKSQMTHHAVTGAQDGTVWVLSRHHHTAPVDRLPILKPPFFEDTLLQLSRDGKVMREISLPGLMIKNDLAATLTATGTLDPVTQFDDFMHNNDIEILTADKAAAFPLFEAGDIALSMRDLNMIVVFDPDTETVKWHHVGPWLRQHDPDFLPDGTISVFDNRWAGSHNIESFGGSRILRIDPVTRKVTTAYRSGKDQPRFFTHIMGVHQTFASGNILIAQPTYGRVFEVTRDGEIVWEYINRLNKDYLGHVTIAEKFPTNYFTFDKKACTNNGGRS